MTARITITIPDSLHAQLQEVKENLNVSALCQKAIEQAIRMEKIKMQTLSEKERVIERLRVERQKSEEEWFDQGKKNGLRDAVNLSYEDFEQLSSLYDHKDEYDYHGIVWIELHQFPEELQDLLAERMKDYRPKPIESSYLAGWLDGVTDFWDEIKDEI